MNRFIDFHTTKFKLINNLIFFGRKSYGYQVQEPPAESKVDDTKYKFDYMLQAPVEEKQEEAPQRTLNTKVDRVVEDKPGK